jgi:NAD(P)-dependent dehydrogenase (short-subunit alcohol dehydrogenase family)
MARVLITGGSKGIGFACARQLAARGWEIESASRGPLWDPSAADGAPRNWQHRQHDLLASLPLEEWRSFFESGTGPRVLVQCLGGTLGVRNATASVEDWKRVMELNFFLPLRIHQALVPLFRNTNGATMIFFGSSAVWHGRASTPYVCAKAALHRFVEVTGRELASEGVLVCGIAPAAVSGYGNSWDRCSTDQPGVWAQTAAQQALGRFQTPDEIAGHVAAILEKRPMAIAGEIINLDPGASPPS